jgi:ABC-type amino acid transport substrate-binding protein
LLDNADWATLVAPPKPFHVLPYAYPVKPGDDAWFEVMDNFVVRIQADGRLEAAARRHGLLPVLRPR